MTITAKVVKHSRHPLYPVAPDLVTIECRYPRFIHAELMTHRVFSRNASSSRAVPVWRVIRDVLNDPAVPVSWGSNRPGMQAGEPLTGWRGRLTRFAWHSARVAAVGAAMIAVKAGAHKQVVNRILEPWSHISVIITATEWQNFFSLRCHEAADPTMRALAEAIQEAIRSSTPREFGGREWHLPYVDGVTMGGCYENADSSAARCARVSYLNHDGTAPSPLKDIALARKLHDMHHLSPFEHQARPVDPNREVVASNLGRYWLQYRSVLS